MIFAGIFNPLLSDFFSLASFQKVTIPLLRSFAVYSVDARFFRLYSSLGLIGQAVDKNGNFVRKNSLGEVNHSDCRKIKKKNLFHKENIVYKLLNTRMQNSFKRKLKFPWIKFDAALLHRFTVP